MNTNNVHVLFSFFFKLGLWDSSVGKSPHLRPELSWILDLTCRWRERTHSTKLFPDLEKPAVAQCMHARAHSACIRLCIYGSKFCSQEGKGSWKKDRQLYQSWPTTREKAERRQMACCPQTWCICESLLLLSWNKVWKQSPLKRWAFAVNIIL